MMSERYKKFIKNDPEFMANVYSNLANNEKWDLWFVHWTFDLRESSRYDFFDKFNPDNYAKWKSIEPDINKFFNMLFRLDEDWEDASEEIKSRLGITE